MSKYLVNKFLYTVDRDPDLVERYREDPRGTVAWWEAERANVILNCTTGESSTWLAFATRSATRRPGAVEDPFAVPASHQSPCRAGSSRTARPGPGRGRRCRGTCSAGTCSPTRPPSRLSSGTR